MSLMFLDKWFTPQEQDEIQVLLEKAYDRAQQEVFPPKSMVFRALEGLAPNDCKVCILGQDPYHGKGQAHGLSFSVPKGVALPPSLRNIYKELQSDVGVERNSGDLSGWADQGVLLLNSVLTVQESQAGAHEHLGWQRVTDGVLQKVAQNTRPTVFLAWGAWAQKAVTNALKNVPEAQVRHLVLSSVHPSPLSAHRGFFGSKPFSKANAFLQQHERTPIDWGK